MRGWLLLDAFAIPFTARYALLRTPGFDALRAGMAPSRQVPALAVSDGVRPPAMVWETLAIAETVHEHRPQAGLWPEGDARLTARSLAAEMHAGFRALRNACPMNLRRAYAGFSPDAEVRADLDRLAELWAYARARRSVQRAGEGPFLFGAFRRGRRLLRTGRKPGRDLRPADGRGRYGLCRGAARPPRGPSLARHGDSGRPCPAALRVRPAARADPYAPEVVGRAVERGTSPRTVPARSRTARRRSWSRFKAACSALATLSRGTRSRPTRLPGQRSRPCSADLVRGPAGSSGELRGTGWRGSRFPAGQPTEGSCDR